MLRFDRDGRFRIVQFTDTHFCDGSDEDRRTRDLMERVLDAERPDLVALTGDVIDGARAVDPARAWADAVAAMVERDLPWAAVFGNHDDEGAASRAELMRIQRGLPGCLTEPGPKGLSGIGNYLLAVASGDETAPAAILYFLDSGSHSRTGAGTYAWLAHDQVAWYRKTSRLLNRGREKPFPALAFFHIPLPEYALAWERGLAKGARHEEVCAPELNSGLFLALHECGDVLGTFVGHDHVNDFDAELHGLRLCYGRATGYNEYGRDGFARGARVIELREGERGFRTWLRLDGEAALALHVQRPGPDAL